MVIVWIHILAFDQAIGAYIYTENMKHRKIAIPLQSVILFFTLWFGPVDYLLYKLLSFKRLTS